jgi:hypothetical protein
MFSMGYEVVAFVVSGVSFTGASGFSFGRSESWSIETLLALSFRAERRQNVCSTTSKGAESRNPEDVRTTMLTQGVFTRDCPGNLISLPQLSARSCQRGFSFSISQIFFSRRQRLICFSRAATKEPNHRGHEGSQTKTANCSFLPPCSFVSSVVEGLAALAVNLASVAHAGNRSTDILVETP